MKKVISCGALALLLLASWHPDARAQQKVRLNPLIDALAQGKVVNRRHPDDPNKGDKPWTAIDLEHSRTPTLTEVQAQLLKTLKERKPNGQLLSAPVVRIPTYGFEESAWLVKQVLDSGALGVVFPHIETAEQAMKAVRSMRFPPQRGTKYPTPAGFRGSGSVPHLWRAANITMTVEEYREMADLWPLNPKGRTYQHHDD